MRGVEGAFLTLALLIRAEMIADEREHGWNQGARDHEEVAVEDADELEECVVAWHNLAGLDARDVHLRQTEAASQLPLAPAPPEPRLLQLPAQVLRKALEPERLAMLCDIRLHDC